jgi:predicted transcriptional regulator
MAWATTQVCVRLTRAQKRALDMKVTETSEDRSNIVRRAVDDWLDRYSPGWRKEEREVTA